MLAERGLAARACAVPSNVAMRGYALTAQHQSGTPNVQINSAGKRWLYNMPDDMRARVFWLAVIACCSLILGVLAGLVTFDPARERIFGANARLAIVLDTKRVGPAEV
jgi:hypothetical protein